MNIYCLDDDPLVERVMGRFLERLGHAPRFFRAGGAFQAAVTEAQPDLVLLDLNLGQESGIDMLQWLAAAEVDVPLVLLSGEGGALLDTARRVAQDCHLPILGAVSKSDMVSGLPPLLRQAPTPVRAPVAPEHRGAPAIPTDGRLSAGALQRLIGAGAVVPYFQPIVSPTDGRLRGAEVLARLQLPNGRILGAAEVVPLAESADLLYALTASLFDGVRACAPRLTQLGLGFLSVNLSPSTLEDGRTLGLVRELIEGLRGRCAVKIELTETAAAAQPHLVRKLAAQLHLLGTSLAIDDFGVGFNSMRALAELPFDTLKIDLSFVAEMFDSPKALKILRAIIGFGRGLGMQVVAEGVETEAQREVLVASGVDLAQGFLFGAPVSVDTFVLAWGAPPCGPGLDGGLAPGLASGQAAGLDPASAQVGRAPARPAPARAAAAAAPPLVGA